MIYVICWGKYEVVKIEKIDRKYISIIDKEKFLSAIEDGMPSILLSQIHVVFHELPKFIINRIHLNTEFNEENVISYIKKTECRYNTDRFSVKVYE